ncbi:MAG TPA: sigma-70 family RNA polymerase sigma factor [Terriglobales bacterium]|nr:sigma-70 family RNA polymerase sigma factor [Terriglobales bacterium]
MTSVTPPPEPAVQQALASVVSDTDLIARCRRRDEAAWEQLVRRYHRLVVAVARKHRLNDDDAGEVVDGVFAELWRSLGQIDRPDRVRSWLVTVARRHSLAQLQYQRRWVNLAEIDTQSLPALRDPAPNGDSVLLEAEQEQAMRVALARLAPRCRRVLEWLFYSDPPPDYEEIGKRLGVATNSIGFIRGRCLRKLRQALQDEEAAQGWPPVDSAS